MQKIFLVEDDGKLNEHIKPNLVLLDINVPYYDGFYFCRIFRRKSTIPIILKCIQI